MSLRRLLLLAPLSVLLQTPARPQAASPAVAAAASASTAVPPLVPYSGVALSSEGKAVARDAGVTFLIYREAQGGEPLWTESQTVAIDATGHYKAQLGAASPSGLPAELFATGEARWLEVQVAGEPAQPRVLLASVPYALKAADAATLGGLPASAFALAGSKAAGVVTSASTSGISPDATSNVTTTGGTSGYLPVFNGASTVVDSILFSTSTGLGVGDVPNASAVFDVNGKSIWRGTLNVARAGNPTASAGVDSYPLYFQAGSYNSSTKGTLLPAFQLQVEPTGNNTASPSASFNLLYTANSGTPAETGLFFNPNGTIHFAPGQTFPGTGTGNGTITGVAAGTALTGGGTEGNLKLNVDTSKVPLLAGNNTFAGTMTVQGAGAFGTGGTASQGLTGTGTTNGVYGLATSNANNSIGVLGIASTTTGLVIGVDGYTASTTFGSTGVSGFEEATSGNVFGVYGQSASSAGAGVAGIENSPTGVTVGVLGSVASGSGVAGEFINTSGSGLILHGQGNGGATVFSVDTAGNVNVTGKLTKGSGSFKIDDPLDPANKYLSHSFVESPDMMNVYNGNITTDKFGRATVVLPEYFESLNRDFRYQLTVMGQFAQAIVDRKIGATKIGHNRFVIRTDRPSVEVSWQVTGIRKDAYANANRIPEEEEKPETERGYYLHPEVFGQPASKGIVAAQRVHGAGSEVARLAGSANR
jgi:hypothetical protein